MAWFRHNFSIRTFKLLTETSNFHSNDVIVSLGECWLIVSYRRKGGPSGEPHSSNVHTRLFYKRIYRKRLYAKYRYEVPYAACLFSIVVIV